MNDLVPVRTLVVGAASRHGSTAELADHLAASLQRRLPPAWSVVRSDLTDLRVLDDADVVVLGSAIYLGRWLRPAKRALKYLQEADPVQLWLFSAGPISDLDEENKRVIAADELVIAGDAVEHQVFAGSLDLARLTWFERLVVTIVKAVPGDHRDWHAVDDWAAHIAAHLIADGARTSGTTDGPEGDHA
jgi:menaquinone-dependent protoporphyrinogen oxidase